MNVSPELQARIKNDVARYVAIAAKHFNKTFYVPDIDYNLRGGTAGTADGATKVSFNAVLLNENVEKFIARTVPHEVAHCIDSANGDNTRPSWAMRNGRRLKRSIHGPTWKNIMRLFGVRDITRCHSYDVKNAQTKVKQKFEYKCGGCNRQYIFSSVRHSRIANGKRAYWCKSCGRGPGNLVYVQNLGKRSYEDAQKVADARHTALARLAGKPAPSKVVPLASLLPTGGLSHMERARTYFQMHRGASRQEIISGFVQVLGLKALTASTYYNTLKGT